MNQAIISVGSNINPEENIRKAKDILQKEQEILAESRFTDTKPEGFSGQPDFINGALYIQTGLNRGCLESYLKELEKKLGRERTGNKDGPRIIDLDIIVFNKEIVSDDFFRYSFVKNATLELIPDIEKHAPEQKKEIPNGINREVIEKSFREILEHGLNIDLNDPNFADTPKRVAKSYAEIFSGLHSWEQDMEKMFSACFPTEYKGIVAEKDITVFSMCPHHFLPVRYRVAVGYIPSSCGIGLSKLSRIIELLSKRPILQETFTQEIVDQIDKHMKPLGVICFVEGQHYCMQMRGAKQKDVITTTSAVKGSFMTKPEMEVKFYELIKER